jgi:biotin operon repressor
MPIMLYERSRQIEDRLDALLRLIETGRYSTPALAAALKISIPTVSRGIDALRGRGYPIRTVHEHNSWYYALDATNPSQTNVSHHHQSLQNKSNGMAAAE